MVSASPEYDVVVIGAGPNGLAAAVELQRSGRSVLVLEGHERIGGGTRTQELTLPGFHHDLCSAIHPTGILSPFFSQIPLRRHGLEWIEAEISVAHPLPGEPAALLRRSVAETGETLGADRDAWRRLVEPFLHQPRRLFEDLLSPLRGLPGQPLTMARFGLVGLGSAEGLARRRFGGARAAALFAGCAAHSVLPLERALTAAVGLIFAVSAHTRNWPCARGGSQAITAALAAHLESLGGEIATGRPVGGLAELPTARAVFFDTAPRQMLEIAGDALPAGYRRRLERYRYGPAVFKVDWALDGPIPWSDAACGRASTVHVGGTLEEVAASERAMWRGEHSDRPFLLVCQQSVLDASRAPAGKHTGYAYCHVPAGSTVDMTERVETQMERFAPGFRDLVLARHSFGPRDFEAYNPAFVGGAITGGVMDLGQFFARPTLRWSPYTTPNPRLFLCSSATPPGGGVHGMCGYHAARAALKRVLR